MLPPRWVRVRVPLVVLVLLAAGCTGGDGGSSEPARATVEPLAPGGEHAPCSPSHALQLAVNAVFTSIGEETGLPPGIHRVAREEVVWIWASYEESLREDRLSRANEVRVFRDEGGQLYACTRAEILTPTDVDAEPRAYDVGARFTFEGMPEGPLRVVVNWVASCATCPGLARGNATADV